VILRTERDIHPPITDGRIVFNDDTEVAIDFNRYAGNILFTPEFYIRSEQPHRMVRIRELSFIRNKRKHYLLKNERIKIPDLEFFEDDGKYRGIVGTMRIGVNIQFLFRDMEPGDKIEIEARCVYTFDREPMREKQLKYTVVCFPGRGIVEPALFILILFHPEYPKPWDGFFQ
jgi:hypothetical protein